MGSSRKAREPAWARLLVVVLLLLAGCTNDDVPDASAPSVPASGSTAGATGGNSDREGTEAGSTDPGIGTDEEPVELRDPAGRRTASGTVPRYVEIDGASVRPRGGRLEFRVVLAEPAPDVMPAGAGFRVSFQLLTPDERHLNLDAQASKDGWVASAAGGSEPGFPGEMTLAGRSVALTIDRSYVGLTPFRWLASVAYTKGGAYGFDALPEQGFARYP